VATQLIGAVTKINVGQGAIRAIAALGTVATFVEAVGSGVVKPVGTLSRVTTFVRSVGQGTIGPAGGKLYKVVGKLVGKGTLSPVGILDVTYRALQVVGSGVITPIGTLATLKMTKWILSVGGGAIAPVGKVSKKIYKLVGRGTMIPRAALSASWSGFVAAVERVRLRYSKGPTGRPHSFDGRLHGPDTIDPENPEV